jgi:hypothetical protein
MPIRPAAISATSNDFGCSDRHNQRVRITLGAPLGGELIAVALELLVVVDREIQHPASLMDALRHRFGMANRELLLRTAETPIEGVLTET